MIFDGFNWTELQVIINKLDDVCSDLRMLKEDGKPPGNSELLRMARYINELKVYEEQHRKDTGYTWRVVAHIPLPDGMVEENRVLGEFDSEKSASDFGIDWMFREDTPKKAYIQLERIPKRVEGKE